MEAKLLKFLLPTIVNSNNEESAVPSISNGNSGSPTFPQEEQQPPSKPDTVTPTPEQPRTSGTDYSGICSTLQPALIPHVVRLSITRMYKQICQTYG